MKRVLALLILAACLLPLIACSAEPLPTVTAVELMDKAMDKMTACSAYEAETLYEITINDTFGEQGTVRMVDSYKVSERGFVWSVVNTVLTAEGEPTYSVVQSFTCCDNMMYAMTRASMDGEIIYNGKYKEYAEDLSLPKDPLEVFSFFTPEAMAQATVTCGTMDWTITLPVSALEGDASSDPTEADSGEVVTIVISRLYTVKSISFSIEEDGQTITFRSSFFGLGRDRVAPPSDAEDYEERPVL